MQSSKINKSFGQNFSSEIVFCNLYARSKQRLHNYLVSLIKDTFIAEDITQEVFLKLWTKREMYQNINDLESYLFRIARNEAFDLLRWQHQNRVVFQAIKEQQSTEEDFTANMVVHRELQRHLQLAIQSLSPQRKKVYMLSIIEGWRVEKIALVLGIAIPTVKETIKQAKKQIRNQISIQSGIPYKKTTTRNKTFYSMQINASKAA